MVACVKTYLNNHLKMTVYYHSDIVAANKEGATPADICRIVAFEVYPQRCAGMPTF